MLSSRRLDRLEDVCRYKREMRVMVAVAYNVDEDEAKSLLHAMTNGKSLARWRSETAPQPVTAESLDAGRERITELIGLAGTAFITAHESWAIHDGELLWLVQYQTDVAIAIDDVHQHPAL